MLSYQLFANPRRCAAAGVARGRNRYENSISSRFFVTALCAQIPVGKWTFDNASDLLAAEAGYLECLKDGFITVHPVTNDDLLDSPQQVSVYPNPFRDVLSISTKGIAPHSRAAVYNVKGQKVADLSISDVKGDEVLWQWDGCDAKGSICSSGIYILRMQSDKLTVSHKLQLIRK